MTAYAYSFNSDSLLFLKKNIDDVNDSTYEYTANKAKSAKLLKSKAGKSEATIECTVAIGSSKIYKDVKLFVFSDSSVKILNGNKSREILIKDIRSIKFEGPGFWKGALYGSGGALFIGFILGTLDTTYEYLWDGMKLGLALTVPLAIIGGLTIKKDKNYNLSKLNLESKRKKIKQLIRQNSAK